MTTVGVRAVGVRAVGERAVGERAVGERAVGEGDISATILYIRKIGRPVSVLHLSL